jgi:hypothetical protein
MADAAVAASWGQREGTTFINSDRATSVPGRSRAAAQVAVFYFGTPRTDLFSARRGRAPPMDAQAMEAAILRQIKGMGNMTGTGGSFMDDVQGFLHAIDWTEPFLKGN